MSKDTEQQQDAGGECDHPIERWEHETFWNGRKYQDAYYCGVCRDTTQVG